MQMENRLRPSNNSRMEMASLRPRRITDVGWTTNPCQRHGHVLGSDEAKGPWRPPAPHPVSRLRGNPLHTSCLAQPEFGPDGANDSKDPQEGHDLIVVELARVEDIGRLDEGVIRERADHDARRPEHAEDPQGYPPCLHKMENENANEGGRAHRDDGFEDRNWHRGLRCSVTLSAFRISPPPIESNRHIFDEETASAGTEQAANDTSAYRFHLVRRRQGSRSPRERTHFDNTISIALTFVARPSSAVTFSVAMRTSRTSASGMKRPRTISATSTAREIERPRALTTTSRNPPLKYVTTASTEFIVGFFPM